ncbi:hypothetical protein [Ramlibacter sp.]|uniref:hypothetical protein n=1 Tax=Ramlibacter sp. TaxID=1917967 RepID=UPI003D09C328
MRDREAEALAQTPLVVDEASRLNALQRRAEAEAFAFSDQKVLQGLLPHLHGGPITLAALPVDTAEDAVRLLHAVGAARSAEGRRLIQARKTAGQVSTPYFQADDYELSVEPMDGMGVPSSSAGRGH